VPSLGLKLARGYHADVVRPLLHARWPALQYAAARLGGGSEVLGLDEETSRDHDFGLRLVLLVGPDWVQPVRQLLQAELPESYAGWPTRFATTWDPDPGHHHIDVLPLEELASRLLGLPPDADWEPADWLSLTGQAVLEVTAGAVFHDSPGQLTALRRRLAWYPPDVERYIIATDWRRLAQELPFVGRTGQRGDDAGSRVVAGRLARTVMHLGLVLCRRWPPYAKWLGTHVVREPRLAAVAGVLDDVLAASDWSDRQTALAAAANSVHEVQRETGLSTGSGPAVQPFHDRPFLVVRDSVAQLLLDDVTDPQVRSLPAGVGSVEQWVDSVDVLLDATRRRAATAAALSSSATSTAARTGP
jgi:hypothetical protein